MIGLGAISLYALGAVATSYGLGAALMGKLLPEAPKVQAKKKASVRIAVAARTAAQKRTVIPEKIALLVVEYLRDEGHNEYPFIPEDLDAEIIHFCDASGIERVSTQRVRELIALLPGVYRPRPRLSMSDPKHRYVRARMLHYGRKVGEKATYYEILDTPCEEPATPVATPLSIATSGQPDQHLCPSPVRTVRTRDRKSGQNRTNVRPDIRMEAA